MAAYMVIGVKTGDWQDLTEGAEIEPQDILTEPQFVDEPDRAAAEIAARKLLVHADNGRPALLGQLIRINANLSIIHEQAQLEPPRARGPFKVVREAEPEEGS